MLSVGSRVLFKNALKFAKNTKVVNSFVCARGINNIADKQKGEENSYFRKEDEKKKAALKAQFEHILELDDKDPEKIEVLELLEHKKEEEGFVSKYGLNDWKVAVPLGLLIGFPAISNEVILLDVDAVVGMTFFIFVVTVYTQTSATVSKFIEDHRQSLLKKLQAADDNLLVDLKDAVKANEKCLQLEGTIKDVYSLTDNLSIAQADLLNAMEQHKLRELTAKKLDSLLAVEEAASVAIRQRILTTISDDVKSTFTKDKKAKDTALAQAIAVLTGSPKEDVVGNVFKKAVINYRDEYAKKPAGSDEILNQLERDVAEILKFPTYATDAGNVYQTHPLPGLAK